MGLKIESRKTRQFYTYISPWLIGLLIFTITPLVMSFYFSFTKYDLFNPPKYIGASNYLNLFKDQVFWISIRNTLFFALIKVPLSILIPLFIAVQLNKKLVLKNFFRSVFYIPSIIPAVSTILLWSYMYSGDFGLLNYVFSWLGIEKVQWFAPGMAMQSIIIMNLFSSIGPTMVIFLAALQGVPRVYFEAITIDGGNKIQTFWHITLPMISPAIFYLLITGLINALQVFMEVMMTTGGGPNYTTTTLALNIYNNAMTYQKMGYASANAWIVCFMTLVLTFVFFKVSSKFVYYEGE